MTRVSAEGQQTLADEEALGLHCDPVAGTAFSPPNAVVSSCCFTRIAFHPLPLFHTVSTPSFFQGLVTWLREHC